MKVRFFSISPPERSEVFSKESWGFYIGWMLALLFLASGSLRIAVSPIASRRTIKATRILALVFALLALASLGGCFASGAAYKFNG